MKIKCISEVGWFDTKVLIGQMKAAGGPKTNQWIIPWDQKNAAGSCSLIDMEALDGGHHKFLIDTGCPVVRGSARFGSKSDLYVGNGDEVFFG